MLYVVIISVCWLLLTVVDTLCFQENFWEVLLVCGCAIVAVVIVDAIVATCCRLLPKRCVPYEGKVFRVSKREKLFYERVGIRKWKDKIPEIGHFTGFRKTKVEAPKSIEYVERFLLECRYGEVGHFVSCIFGFILLIPLPFLPTYSLAVTLPVAIINALLNLPSLLILRYNSYKLDILYQSNLKRQARSASVGNDRAL